MVHSKPSISVRRVDRRRALASEPPCAEPFVVLPPANRNLHLLSKRRVFPYIEALAGATQKARTALVYAEKVAFKKQILRLMPSTNLIGHDQ